jgi:hypothetical protein
MQPYLLNQLEEDLQAKVLIKRLKCSATGELTTETVETLLYSAVDFKEGRGIHSSRKSR